MKAMLSFVLLLVALTANASPGQPYFVRSTSSQTWTPLNLPTLQYWWVASDIPVGNTVTNWVDRIHAFPASQDTPANRPTNSATGIYFSGSTFLTNNPYNTLVIGSTNIVANSTNFGTLYVICRPLDNPDFSGIVTFYHSGQGGYGFRSRTANQFNCVGGNFLNGHNFATYATNEIYDVGIAWYYQNHTECYTNGVFIADTLDGTFGNFTYFGGGEGQNNFKGYITEIICLWTNATQADINLLHGYATNTYWPQFGHFSMPVITAQPSSISCLTNSVQSFTVTATGVPPPSYFWRTNGVSLTDGSMWSGTTTSNLWVTNGSTLFTNLEVTCIVSNYIGSVTSAVAYLSTVTDLITNGMVAWWKFDEGAGDIAGDSMGTNTLYLTNSPSWISGINSNGINFSAGNKYGFTSTTHTIPAGNSARSFACWVKPTAYTDYGLIADYGALAAQQRFGIIILKTAPYIGVEGGISVEFNGSTEYSSSKIAYTGTWTHFVVTTTGTDNATKIYTNGVACAVTYNGLGPFSLATAASRVYLHNDVGVGNASPAFSMDDFRVYNRVLTTNEIQTLYQLRY